MSRVPAVFFDRDGTLMANVGYCGDPELVRVLPGVSEALARLKRAGFVNVIVTNQSGIGRGLITEAQYREVHAALMRALGPGLVDATYFAPDSPERPTPRRKPLPGMLLEAAEEHGIELARSFLIGDTATDIECGQRAGLCTILLQGGPPARCTPSHCAAGVAEAVDWILGRR